jgi:hypothetical protein
LTLVSTKTKFPIQTVTPTSTVTSDTIEIDTITLPQNTDTITSTDVTTSTSTLVVDISQTNTVDVTVTTTEPPTVTASTAANFTPFASEAAVIAAGGGTSESKKRRDAPRVPRRGLDDLAARGQSAKKKFGLQSYPNSVKCIVQVEDIASRTKTITAKTTKTRTAPAVIATDTETETITSTVVPGDAFTTVVTTSTATSLSVTVNLHVTTITSTTTATSFAGAAVTYYPQCQSNNLITYIGGSPLYFLNPGITTFTAGTAPDGVTCCQMCAALPDCSGFSGPSPGYNDCYLFGDQGTCDASTPYFQALTGNPVNSDYDVVGNGNCGQGSYGGTEP